jgi:hypothetical protein
MNLLEHMRTFSRVAALSSFTQAAGSLGLPRASVSTAMQQLENLLGARLLHRTTRKVLLTQDGQSVYERCAGKFEPGLHRRPAPRPGALCGLARTAGQRPVAQGVARA